MKEQLQRSRGERSGEVRRARPAVGSSSASSPGLSAASTGSWRLKREKTSADARRVSSLPRGLVLGRLVRGGVLIGLAGLAAVGVVQVASWVERSHALPVRTVAVRTVDPAVTLDAARTDEILAYAGVAPGEPLFAVDIDAVAKRVLEHPFVASATVRRAPPDGVEIVVVPRSPRAALATPTGLYVIDAHGQVMKSARAGDGLDLPVITGIAVEDVAAGAAQQRLADAVALLDAHARAGAPGGAASEVHVISEIGFELILEDGTRVRVGNDGVEAKIARLDAVVKRLAAGGRSASFIYLDDDRRPERAAVRLRPVAETPLVGGKDKASRERG